MSNSTLANLLHPARTLLCALLMAPMLFGCAARMSGEPDEGGSDMGGTISCKVTDNKCNGAVYQTCEGGVLKKKTCIAPKLCSDKLGCVDCLPDTQTCMGDEVRSCNAAGEVGAVVETCAAGMCLAGKCIDNCGGKKDEPIYVIDESYNLLSFNPMDNTFKTIGKVSCPAGPNLPGWGGLGPATPFSMSVDRMSRAWVLFTSGEIFWVSTKDAACTATTFKKAQNGLELFGMGFVSDAKGSNDETLYVAGGAAGSVEDGKLAKIDPKTLMLTNIGNLKAGDYGPELTGTGNGEFYGYFPASTRAIVAQIDKTNAQNLKEWPVQALNGTPRAWAFAHWGGRFYIFITIQDFVGNQTSQVHLFDPKDGKTTVILPKIPHVIVGAGVSTCAPVVIG